MTKLGVFLFFFCRYLVITVFCYFVGRGRCTVHSTRSLAEMAYRNLRYGRTRHSTVR